MGSYHTDHRQQREQEHRQRAHQALDEVLKRVLAPQFTGTAGLELKIREGGITNVVLLSEEQR